MDGWLHRMSLFFNEWAIRIVVLSSFTAHLVLVLLAGIRRRKGSGGRTLVLWLAYQLADWAATYALGNLSLGSTSREQQLVAFWAPFLLLQLGGPDNITAFSLEDNVLSGRLMLHLVAQVTGAMYVLYKHVYTSGGGGVLFPASIIIFCIGVAKYIERAIALQRGNLANMRSSSKSKHQQWNDLVLGGFRRSQDLGNEQALLVAHDLFRICRRAMVDSSVMMDSTSCNDHDISRKIFYYEWEEMCKVVEMELSLMYDILYTKAAMVHTWGGFLIRIVSPFATATALFLFSFYGKEGQRRADVIITYILLVAAIVLDLRWFFRALGSTWTHAFLQARPHSWFNDTAVLFTPRWHQLRRVVVALDPGRILLLRSPKISYRLWSGTIGQYNLLHDCTCETTTLGSSLAAMVGLENRWNEYHRSEGLQLTRDVKALLFERVKEILESTFKKDEKKKKIDKKDAARRPVVSYSMNEITTLWGQKAVRTRGEKLRRYKLAFGREFQEDILVWHIGTQVFLLCSDQQLIKGKNAAASSAHVKAIMALSQYLMFLVSDRQYMLPGLVLRSLYEGTRDALKEIWRKGKKFDTSSTSTKRRDEMKMLAQILSDEKKPYRSWGLGEARIRLISDGTSLALTLLQADDSDIQELLELIFNVWIDKLLYAGTRCSRDSHAKQLSRGGELTTIAWMLAEHAGPFRIGELSSKDKQEKKDGEKKPEPKPELPMQPPPHYPLGASGYGYPTTPWPYVDYSTPLPDAAPPTDKPKPKIEKDKGRKVMYETLYPED